MEEINEIKIPKGVESISVTQHDDKIVIEFVPKEPKFKNGDFVYEDGRIMIIDKFSEKGVVYHALIYPTLDLKVLYNNLYAPKMLLSSLSFRYATEEEKQLLIDAMEKDGKRWDTEKLIVEDIPQRKFKPGDKVKLKDGMLDKRGESPYFTAEMDMFIGKVLTVKRYTSKGHIFLNEAGGWAFAEDWLEPYSDEPIVGELAIFWDSYKEHSQIRLYAHRTIERHRDHEGMLWANAIKFISKEQFEKHIKE